MTKSLAKALGFQVVDTCNKCQGEIVLMYNHGRAYLKCIDCKKTYGMKADQKETDHDNNN